MVTSLVPYRNRSILNQKLSYLLIFGLAMAKCASNSAQNQNCALCVCVAGGLAKLDAFETLNLEQFYDYEIQTTIDSTYAAKLILKEAQKSHTDFKYCVLQAQKEGKQQPNGAAYAYKFSALIFSITHLIFEIM